MFWGWKWMWRMETMVFLSSSYSRQQKRRHLGCTIEQPQAAIKVAPGRSRTGDGEAASSWAALALGELRPGRWQKGFWGESSLSSTKGKGALQLHTPRNSPGGLGGTWASQPQTSEVLCMGQSIFLTAQNRDWACIWGKMRDYFRCPVAHSAQWIGVRKRSFLLDQNTRALDIKLMKSILQLKL